MARRPHPRYADVTVPPQQGSAWNSCDRCGWIVNHNRMTWDRQWAGFNVINRGFLTCPRCVDVLQEQLRSIVVPADPVPIMNARIEAYAMDENDVRVTMNGFVRITQTGNTRATDNSATPLT